MVIDMNLLEQINSELKNKHFSDFECVRYIYLRVCEIFSFNSKYFFHKFLSKDEWDNIVNGTIDIKNLNTNLAVCHTISRDVLLKLIRELTSANVRFYESLHSYLIYEEKPGHLWMLDAANGDFSRVKLNLKTSGFYNMYKSNSEKIVTADMNIGYNYTLKQDYLNKIDLSSDKTIFSSINNLLSNSKCKYTYSDSIYFIRWLLLAIIFPFNESTGIDDDCFYSFFEASNNNIFYLSKNEDEYSIKEITKEKCIKLTK